ncbi:hypothetical protein [Streptomyces odonnellii]|nr:hypothetical protein [Streptomyces odonnellii]
MSGGGVTEVGLRARGYGERACAGGTAGTGSMGGMGGTAGLGARV